MKWSSLWLQAPLLLDGERAFLIPAGAVLGYCGWPLVPWTESDVSITMFLYLPWAAYRNSRAWFFVLLKTISWIGTEVVFCVGLVIVHSVGSSFIRISMFVCHDIFAYPIKYGSPHLCHLHFNLMHCVFLWALPAVWQSHSPQNAFPVAASVLAGIEAGHVQWMFLFQACVLSPVSFCFPPRVASVLQTPGSIQLEVYDFRLLWNASLVWVMLFCWDPYQRVIHD